MSCAQCHRRPSDESSYFARRAESCARPSDVPSYPVRDLAFEAALDAQRRDEARDYSEEDFVDLDTPDCENPANEPLCEAIMEKARSYSVDEVYSARTYKRAAEKVASLTVSVFTLTDAQQRRLGVGPKTNQFIYLWICQKAYEAQKAQEQKKGMSHLEEEFLGLQRHIQNLVRLTKDKPVFQPILRSLDIQVSNLLFVEKTQ